ncbi:MAG: MFS transporter, partial [Betaproteobacteria bacterium]
MPRVALLLYALGSIGTGLFSSVTGVLLLFYVTDTLGVPPALAGLALFLPKAWDVLFDPLVGAASDRHTGPRGRRQPFL